MVNTVNTNNTSSTTSNVSANKSALGKDDFLKLMIAQMKNQDPMNPMDGTQYAAQLAQFSSLEQLANLNSNITKTMETNQSLTQSINNTMIATLIGKDVKLSGSDVQIAGQDQVVFGYNLPQTAAAAEIKIYNDQGSLVRTIKNVPTAMGLNKLSWDLSDNNAKKLQNGSYSFEIEAVDMDGKDITTSSFKEGKISGVRYTENGTILLIDGAEYSLSSILEILNSNSGGE